MYFSNRFLHLLQPFIEITSCCHNCTIPWNHYYSHPKAKLEQFLEVDTVQNNVVLLLTSHGEDARWWWLAVGWHRMHPEGGGWLGDRGHGHASRGHNRWGWEWNYTWQIDIIHDKRIVAMVKWTKVTTDTKSFFYVRDKN